jgi:hypothetical protein
VKNKNIPRSGLLVPDFEIPGSRLLASEPCLQTPDSEILLPGSSLPAPDPLPGSSLLASGFCLPYPYIPIPGSRLLAPDPCLLASDPLTGVG